MLEATDNALAIARIVVGEVLLAHAQDLRAINHTKVNTDKVDAKVPADLLAADLVPTVCFGDERTRMMRRMVSGPRGLVNAARRSTTSAPTVLHPNHAGRPADHRSVRTEETSVDGQEGPAARRAPHAR